MIKVMRRLTLLKEGASERIKIMLKVNLSLDLNQHVGNMLIRERPKNIILGKFYKEKKERLYLLINELI
jgi:hypothetical protein